ncbi:hypothetical protein [Ferrovibrio sp.]|uniref:Y-family DNA polymerase n=1 Tax=Ferrovibrio sp. TaxID=1917215 RepID=UPI00345BAE04
MICHSLVRRTGCFVSRSAEAKALGIPMGAPLFEWRTLVERECVAVFSSNYRLYADMSARVVEVLAQFAPLEVYSIDESFLDLDGIEAAELVSPT